MQFYILHNGQQMGPMNKEELVNYGLQPGSMVWHQELVEWTPASNVPELADLLNAAPQPGPKAEWYVITNGQQQGPFTTSQLQSLQLTRETPVWKEGLSDWKPAYQIPELAAKFISVQAPAIPQPYMQQPQQYQQPQMPYGATRRSKNMALAIIGIVLGASNLIGLILGIMSLMRVNKANDFYAQGNFMAGAAEDKSAKTMALIAIIISAVFIVALIVGDVLLFSNLDYE